MLFVNNDFIRKISLQVFMVTGGYGSDNLDTTETLDTDKSSWVASGAKLPRPMSGLRAANIDGRVLIFGNHPLFNIRQVLNKHITCRRLFL